MTLSSNIADLATRVGTEIKSVKALIAGKANVSHTHGVTDLTATGAKDGTKFLRDDNTWSVPSGGSGLAAETLGSNFTNGAFGGTAFVNVANTATNGTFYIPISVPCVTTISGFWYQRGTGTTAANVLGALYTPAGARLAASGSVAQGTVPNVVVTVPFSTPVTVQPGVYWLGWMGSSTSATFMGFAGANYIGPVYYAVPAAGFVAPLTMPSAFPSLTTRNNSVNAPMLATF